MRCQARDEWTRAHRPSASGRWRWSRSRRRRERLRRAPAGLVRREPARGAGHGPHGIHQRRRLEHRRPAHAARGRALRRENPRRRHHGRRGGHRRRLPELLRRRDRHLRRLAADRAGGGRGLQEGGHRLQRDRDRQRRHLDHRQPGEHLGRRASRSRSCEDLGREVEGRQLARPRPGLSRTTRCASTGPAPTAARSTSSRQINGEEDVSRSDYSASEDDNVTVQGVAGDRGALGYFGLSYAEENASPSSCWRSTAATAASSRARRRCRTARTRRSRGRSSSTSSTARAAARGQGVPRLPRRPTRRARDRRRASSRSRSRSARRR